MRRGRLKLGSTTVDGVEQVTYKGQVVPRECQTVLDEVCDRDARIYDLRKRKGEAPRRSTS